ncbi:ABC transporter ATP-binding protein [Halobellus ordinarius]|uniref:ABC transporter ATP-binding protein n=1 Tax=Halobellus ordinarius TaxID=3075120 RepID=UPI00288031FF|nr:ABC transporter ATP-binding protein [Halobellus sp. ZY16]
MPHLTISDLQKTYGDDIAVDQVSLSIERELFSVVGPSGAGKSTLLKCIAGLELPDSGTIRLDGEDITNDRPSERATATVFQDLALFPHMSVGENIAYGLKKQGWEPTAIDEQVEKLLDLVQMPTARERSVQTLSGGQRQRVALARSLAVEPAILLLDEPLSSLDANLRAKLREDIRRLQRQTDTTFIYVTHDQDVAMAISDRMAVMTAGSLEQVGTPESVYEEPTTPFAATFLGDNSTIEGTAATDDGESVGIRVGKTESPIRGVASGAPVTSGDQVRGFIKVEDIRVDAGAECANTVSGDVTEKRYGGGDCVLHVATEVGELRARVRDCSEYSVGAKVRLAWQPSSFRLFPAD